MRAAEQEGEEGAYLLGTDTRELRRLGFQHRVWAAETAALWRRAEFGPGQRLLDLGCGPGFASVDLAHLVSPRGRVVAIDRSEQFLAHLRARADAEGLAEVVEARAGELASLTLEPGSFDGAYLRWVLCFLPEPRRLLEVLTEGVKPGGRLVLQDYAHYEAMTLCPPCPAFAGIGAAIGASWRAQGGDLDVGDHLTTWLTELGWSVLHAHPIVHSVRPGSPHWEWLTRFFTGYLPQVVEQELLPEAALASFLAAWRERSALPGTRFLTPPVLEVVAERPRSGG